MSNLLPLLPSHFTPRERSYSQSAALARSASASPSPSTARPQTAVQLPPPGHNLAMNGTPSQGSGLRYPSNKKTIYDRNLNRSKNAELSRAAFAYLFIEMIAYAQKGAKDVGGLEQRYIAHCAQTPRLLYLR